jgi:large subunit ribosomal protein L17
MRHRVALKKLNADTQHRVAMRRNLARSLILHGRVVTTTAKAKAFRPFVERLVTRARKAFAIKDSNRPGYVHSLRVLARDLPEREVLKILVEKIAPLCATRNGGYTRILRDAKNQLGDNAPRAIWEFVDRPKPEEAEGDEAGKAAADEAAAGKKGSKKPERAAKPAAGEPKKAAPDKAAPGKAEGNKAERKAKAGGAKAGGAQAGGGDKA